MPVTTLCATLETPFPWPRHSVSSLDLSTYYKNSSLPDVKNGLQTLSVCWSSIVLCVPSAVFAWEAYEKGSEVHLQADPTKLQLLHQSYRVKKDDFKEKQKETILERVQCRISFVDK